MPLGELWVEGAFYFTSGAGTRKSKYLRENQQCTLCVATEPSEPFNLVFEGRATQVRDVASANADRRGYDDWSESASLAPRFATDTHSRRIRHNERPFET
jgi:hypothetical protein